MDYPGWVRTAAKAGAAVAAVAIVAGIVFTYFVLSICACSKVVPPQMKSSATYHAQNGTLEITHKGGDVFIENTTAAIEVYVIDGNGTTDQTPRREVELPFVAGDTVTISDVETGDDVQLVWIDSDDEADDGDGKRKVIAAYEVPPRVTDD